jgi:small-conductance mechanosensitive channel
MPDPVVAPNEVTPPSEAAPPVSEQPIVGSLMPGAPAVAQPGGESALAFFNPDALPYVFLVILGTALLVRLTQRVANSVAERVMQHRLSIKQAVTLIGFAAYGIAAITSVRALFDLSAQAIFALSGTLAVAAGFLLKDIAEATFAGISILITRPFQVGDRIHFGGYYGEVKEIGLRTVRLVTLDDNLVSIPSNRFLSEPVASSNAGELDCMVVIPFFITPGTDHRRAKEIVHDAILSSRFLYLGKPVTVNVSMKLADHVGAVVELTAKAYVYDARHENSFSTDVTDRVLRAFRNSNVEMPVSAT